jgi:hypothetical protein
MERGVIDISGVHIMEGKEFGFCKSCGRDVSLVGGTVIRKRASTFLVVVNGRAHQIITNPRSIEVFKRKALGFSSDTYLPKPSEEESLE